MARFSPLAMTLVTLVGIEAFAATRQETIRAQFNGLNKTSKGALGRNVYQRPGGRFEVIRPDGTIAGPPRDTIFVVAYRNSEAAKLAAQDFYVGNRFASNYWELHNEFLANAADKRAFGFHPEHARFLATAAIAPKARSMARHMMLEQFYMRKFPKAMITRANMARGTADADHEMRYYSQFAEYLAKHATSPADYFTLFEMQRRWNLTGDAQRVSLPRVRDQVASIYERLIAQFGDTQMTYEFRVIRNSIHNYMTPGVIDLLTTYLRNYQNVLYREDVQDITSLREQVRAYYKTDRKTLQAWVTKLGALLPADAAPIVNSLSDGTSSLAQLEALSQLMVRSQDVFWAKRHPDIIHFVIRGNQFMQSQLAARALNGREDWAARARIAANGASASGILPVESWKSLMDGLAAPQRNNGGYVRARIEDIGRAMVFSMSLTQEAMSPALADWTFVEPSMAGFVDDCLRSSFLTELDLISTYLKKHLPAQNKAPYTIENEGEAYGYLVYLPKGSTAKDIEKLDKTMIVIFAELPLELGVVSGIITEQPQTPLSHVNIKSKSRGTPNVYYPNAARDPMFKEYAEKRALVKVSFKDGKVAVRPASLEEAQAHWKKMRAPEKVDVRADLTDSRVRSTKELRVGDVLTVGAKAANYGEAEKALGEATVREGLAIPFFYYKEFIDKNMYDAQTTLAARIKNLMADPRIQTDREYLVQELKNLQERMRSPEMSVDARLVSELKQRLGRMYPNQSIRFRSSTNSEDLPNFSGAGLYDSFSYDPQKEKKTIESALKQTWASVWTLRAYDERDLFGINHEAVYMAILCSPGFGTELANGVAITRNTVHPNLGKGLYINTQVGEELVTNPDPSMTPEELIVLDTPDSRKGYPYTLKYLKYSKLKGNGPIMTDAEALRLAKHLVKINNHFRMIHDPERKNPNFAMDVEFKVSNIGGGRQLYLKQARPYVAN